jgi:hypothetical protein
MLSNNIKYVAGNSEVLVICNKDKEFKSILKDFPDKIILDFVRIARNIEYNGKYEGICW